MTQRRSKQWPPPAVILVRVRDLHSYLSTKSAPLDNIFDRLYGIEQFDEAGSHLRDVLEDLAEDNARGEERKNIHTKEEASTRSP